MQTLIQFGTDEHLFKRKINNFQELFRGFREQTVYMLTLNLQVFFLRHPPNMGIVVPVVMATQMAGVLVFYSPDLGYKLGKVTGVDPLQSAYAAMAGSFLSLVLLPLNRR